MPSTRAESVGLIVADAANVVASAGGAALVAGGGASGALALGAVAAMPQTLSTMVRFALGYKEQQAARWWHAVVHGPQPSDVTPEEIAGRIYDGKDKPYVRETILQSVRALWDSLDDRAVEPLAVLARRYLRESRPPDGFFRGACRVLMELSAADFDDLKSLLTWALASTAREELEISTRDQVEAAPGQWTRVPWETRILRDEHVGRRPSAGETDHDRYAFAPTLADPLRLFFLLRTHGLAHEKGGVSYAAGPNTMIIRRDTATRLVTLLRT
jgi:hypothetical protein